MQNRIAILKDSLVVSYTTKHFFNPKDMFLIDFRERGRERERNIDWLPQIYPKRDQTHN